MFKTTLSRARAGLLATLALMLTLVCLPAPTAWAGSARTPVMRPAVDPGLLVAQANQALNDVLNRRAIGVWLASSKAMQTVVPRDVFSQNLSAHYQQLGALRQRQWVSITRVRREAQTPQDPLPAGDYVTVTFASSFAHKPNAQESVSFYLDSDQVWRMIGIAVQ